MNILKIRQLLLNNLKNIRDNGPIDPSLGICFNARPMSLDPYIRLLMLRIMHEIWENWSEFSGDFNYPISDPTGYYPSNEIFYQYDNMWEEEYGEARKRLLDFLIVKLEEDL